MPNIHPFLVHFPVALLTVSFLFDATGTVRQRQDLLANGRRVMIFGYCGILAAIVSGLIAESAQVIGDAGIPVLGDHKQLAFVAVTLYSILVFWRLAAKGNIPERRRWLFWLIYSVSTVTIWITSWFGGILVFVYRLPLP